MTASLPVFYTPRLVIRPRTMQDTDACIAMDSEPDVTRFVVGPWNDPMSHRAFVEARTAGPYPTGLGYWSLADREREAEFLGWILLIPLDAVGPDIEIGWRLKRIAWGKGYATEAAERVLRHAFETVGLDEVMAEIDPANARSIRVAEKLGLRASGEYRRGSDHGVRYLWTNQR